MICISMIRACGIRRTSSIRMNNISRGVGSFIVVFLSKRWVAPQFRWRGVPYASFVVIAVVVNVPRNGLLLSVYR